MRPHDDANDSEKRFDRRTLLKTSGVGLATLAVPGFASASSRTKTEPFDPNNMDEAAEFVEWLDEQENVEKIWSNLSTAQQQTIIDGLRDVTWEFEEYEPVSTDSVSAAAYDSASYEGKAVAKSSPFTTEYSLKHRIDWEYNFSDYRNIVSTVTPNPAGALAGYVNGTKAVDDEVRQSTYFIQRAKADFELELADLRTVTAECDVKGTQDGEGSTVNTKAPL